MLLDSSVCKGQDQPKLLLIPCADVTAACGHYTLTLWPAARLLVQELSADELGGCAGPSQRSGTSHALHETAGRLLATLSGSPNAGDAAESRWQAVRAAAQEHALLQPMPLHHHASHQLQLQQEQQHAWGATAPSRRSPPPAGLHAGKAPRLTDALLLDAAGPFGNQNFTPGSPEADDARVEAVLRQVTARAASAAGLVGASPQSGGRQLHLSGRRHAGRAGRPVRQALAVSQGPVCPPATSAMPFPGKHPQGRPTPAGAAQLAAGAGSQAQRDPARDPVRREAGPAGSRGVQQPERRLRWHHEERLRMRAQQQREHLALQMRRRRLLRAALECWQDSGREARLHLEALRNLLRWRRLMRLWHVSAAEEGTALAVYCLTNSLGSHLHPAATRRDLGLETQQELQSRCCRPGMLWAAPCPTLQCSVDARAYIPAPVLQMWRKAAEIGRAVTAAQAQARAAHLEDVAAAFHTLFRLHGTFTAWRTHTAAGREELHLLHQAAAEAERQQLREQQATRWGPCTQGQHLSSLTHAGVRHGH